MLCIPAEECLVVEDADAGVEAALAGGMRVLGVGGAAKNPKAPGLWGFSLLPPRFSQIFPIP